MTQVKEKTITVESFFGEKEMTKEQFKKRWRSWFVDFGNLCYDLNDWHKYETLEKWVDEMATASFQRALNKEE